MFKQKSVRLYFLCGLALLAAFTLTSGCAEEADIVEELAEDITKETAEPELLDDFLILATTTSIYDSGLLDFLNSTFTQKTGLEVRVVSQGTGAALETGARGDADVLLVHDRVSELRLVDEGAFVDRFDVMSNDFVIVGPAEDPAGVLGVNAVVNALGLIYEAGEQFISRGDDSGTHRIEKRLWNSAGLDPEGQVWYNSIGQGMGDTLNMASEVIGYAMADRGTYMAMKNNLDLIIVLEGDPVLFNQYGVMAVNPDKHPHVKYDYAKMYIDFLMSDEGQRLINSYQKNGETFITGDKYLSRLFEGLFEAFRLIISFNPDLLQIVFLSLRVSVTAIFLATLIGIPLGSFLGLKEEKKTRLINKIIFTFMGMPPVVAGLIIYLILSRAGPFGVLGLLYTPSAMVIAQVFLATPIITGLTMVGIRAKGDIVGETARSLGADSALVTWTVVKESRYAILGAVITGFSRIVAEVGAVMIVGGNIAGKTRVMTTAIVLETRKGNYELAIGLGIILLMLSFVINSILYSLQKGER